MRAAIKPLTKTLQARLKPDQQSDWELLREILLQASARYLWNSASGRSPDQEHCFPESIPELIKTAKVNPLLDTALQNELNPLIAELFDSLDFWQQIEGFARLNEEFIPAEIRRQQGIFYTPDSVVDLLVRKSLNQLQVNPRNPFAFLDPACGSGLFLIGVLKGVLAQNPNLDDESLSNWILSAHGCDIDDQAIEVARFCLSLIWKHYLPDRDLPDWNVHCFNALEKTNQAQNNPDSEWALLQKFPYLKQNLRLLISNPPYVGERFHRELFDMFKTEAWAGDYIGRSDLYYYFFYLALGLAQKDLVCGLLTPRYFFSASAARHLRVRLQSETQLIELIDFDELKLFAGAMGHHNAFCLFGFDLNKQQRVSVSTSSDRGVLKAYQLQELEARPPLAIAQSELFQGEGLNITWSHQDGFSQIFEQMQAVSDSLKSHFQVSQGIVSGADSLSPKNQLRYQIKAQTGQGIFVLHQAEYEALASQLTQQEIAQWLVPWVKNSDLSPWHVEIKQKRWLIYADRIKHKIPTALLNHLVPFRPILEQRREVKLGRIAWWQLQWPREQSLFESPKLMLPQRAHVGIASLSTEAQYASADIYFIRANSLNELWFLCALLNSPLLSCWWYTMGKRKGNLLELYYEPLQQTPVPLDYQTQFHYSHLIALSQQMSQTPVLSVFQEIHRQVCELYGISEYQQNLIWTSYQKMNLHSI